MEACNVQRSLDLKRHFQIALKHPSNRADNRFRHQAEIAFVILPVILYLNQESQPVMDMHFTQNALLSSKIMVRNPESSSMMLLGFRRLKPT